MPFPWNEASTARLRKLWIEDGLTTAAIAADLSASTGEKLDRNAVCGKLHRLGLSGKGDPGRSYAVQGAPADLDSVAAIPEPSPAREERPAPRFAPAPPPPPPPPPAAVGGVTLSDLRMCRCRFIVSPPGARHALYCGEPSEHAASSWCVAHAAVVFDRRPATERQKQREIRSVLKSQR